MIQKSFTFSPVNYWFLNFAECIWSHKSWLADFPRQDKNTDEYNKDVESTTSSADKKNTRSCAAVRSAAAQAYCRCKRRRGGLADCGRVGGNIRRTNWGGRERSQATFSQVKRHFEPGPATLSLVYVDSVSPLRIPVTWRFSIIQPKDFEYLLFIYIQKCAEINAVLDQHIHLALIRGLLWLCDTPIAQYTLGIIKGDTEGGTQ
jgi:hypothetical protein